MLAGADRRNYRDEAAGFQVVDHARVDLLDLADLADIVDLIAARPERFIIFCDDLSFEEGEAGYKALKVALDGSMSAATDNVLIYATSNRRHLMPEYHDENLQARHVDGEVHPGPDEVCHVGVGSAPFCGKDAG